MTTTTTVDRVFWCAHCGHDVWCRVQYETDGCEWETTGPPYSLALRVHARQHGLH